MLSTGAAFWLGLIAIIKLLISHIKVEKGRTSDCIGRRRASEVCNSSRIGLGLCVVVIRVVNDNFTFVTRTLYIVSAFLYLLENINILTDFKDVT